MKKSLVILSVLTLCVGLTGCVSERNRNNMLELLQDKDVISADWEYISMKSFSASPVPDITSYVYTYSDGEDYYNVEIHNQVVSDDGNDYYWPVSVSDKVLRAETHDVTVSGDTITKVSYTPSEESVTLNYQVRVHHVLFWKWYTLKYEE